MRYPQQTTPYLAAMVYAVPTAILIFIRIIYTIFLQLTYSVHTFLIFKL